MNKTHWHCSFRFGIQIFGVDFFSNACMARCRRNPALYRRFRYSVTSIMLSPNLFRVVEIVSFAPLKMRSVLAPIAGIDNISSGIA